MKKSEMEAHAAGYRDQMARASAAEKSGMVREAIEAAVSAWEHVDGMMRFEQKYEDREASDVAAIDLVLRYAPLLMDAKRLDAVEELLANNKRIQKNATQDLKEKLQTARGRLWENHRLWSHLESNPGAMQDQLRQILGGDQVHWRSVSEAWQRMGLVTRTPQGTSCRLALSTRMGQVVHAKCPRCGKIAKAPKAMFLETVTCPGCKSRVSFVFLSTNSSAKPTSG